MSLTATHQNSQFPSDSARFNGEPSYEPRTPSIHGNQTRHITAPRTDRSRPSGSRPPAAAPYDNHGLPHGAVIAHRRNPQKAHFEPKGHDAALSHVQNHALPISIQTLHGDTSITGIVVRRDRFTVTLERESKSNPGFVYHEIIYKHAIESISLPEFDKNEAR